MAERIEICQGGLWAVLEIGERKEVSLIHFAAVPFQEEDILPYQREKFRLVQLQAIGFDQAEHHSAWHCEISDTLSCSWE